MEIIFILIPLALVFLAIAVAAYFWSVNDGQYDDLDSEASRILFDQKEVDQKGQVASTDSQQTRQPSKDDSHAG